MLAHARRSAAGVFALGQRSVAARRCVGDQEARFSWNAGWMGRGCLYWRRGGRRDEEASSESRARKLSSEEGSEQSCSWPSRDGLARGMKCRPVKMRSYLQGWLQWDCAVEVLSEVPSGVPWLGTLARYLRYPRRYLEYPQLAAGSSALEPGTRDLTGPQGSQDTSTNSTLDSIRCARNAQTRASRRASQTGASAFQHAPSALAGLHVLQSAALQ